MGRVPPGLSGGRDERIRHRQWAWCQKKMCGLTMAAPPSRCCETFCFCRGQLGPRRVHALGRGRRAGRDRALRRREPRGLARFNGIEPQHAERPPRGRRLARGGRRHHWPPGPAGKWRPAHEQSRVRRCRDIARNRPFALRFVASPWPPSHFGRSCRQWAWPPLARKEGRPKRLQIEVSRCFCAFFPVTSRSQPIFYQDGRIA